jgi:hypothetical protein
VIMRSTMAVNRGLPRVAIPLVSGASVVMPVSPKGRPFSYRQDQRIP